MTEEDKQEKKIKENTETEFLENLFRPYLLADENILCVIGSGAGDNENPLQNKKNEKAGKKIMIVRNVIVGFLLLDLYLLLLE